MSSAGSACAECGADGCGPMLYDATWKAITSPGERYLCRDCMEAKLDRPLANLDLWPCPYNFWYAPDLCEPKDPHGWMLLESLPDRDRAKWLDGRVLPGGAS